MIGIGLSWLLLAAVYLALVGSASLAEGAAALACGGLGAVWVGRIARCGEAHLELPPAALAPVLTALGRLPGETLRVGARLLSAIATGAVAGQDRVVEAREVAGRPSGGNDPRDAAGRAVSVLAASLSPDAYVLRLETERGRVQVHALLAGKDGA